MSSRYGRVWRVEDAPPPTVDQLAEAVVAGHDLLADLVAALTDPLAFEDYVEMLRERGPEVLAQFERILA